MSTSTPLNLVPSDPTLYDLLQQFKKEIFLSLFCHHIGTVQSFDAQKQTVSATINYTKTYYQFDQTSKQYALVQVDYPVLVDCPAIVLGGGDGALTFGIEKGDECLILFNDRDIDNWFGGGAKGPVKTQRLHSFSDALILVGVRSLSKVIKNYDTSRATLRKGKALVGVGNSDLIKIANDVHTLKAVLDDLIDQVKAIITVGSSTTQSVSPASQTALEAIKTEIAGLLE